MHPDATPPPTVGPLPAARLDDAADLCERAFARYPLLAALFPGDPADRQVVTRRLYRAIVGDAVRHGRVDAVLDGGAVVAVCAWLPPGAYPQSVGRMLPFLGVATAALRSHPRRGRVGIQALTRLEHHHPAEPPHWYLAAIAVDPAHQRRGLGGTVIRPVLDLADERGEEAFLETADPANAAWYHRLGFDTEVEVPGFDGGPPQWFMRRAPRPA